MLRKGQKAPDFSLPSTSGNQFTLSEDAKDQPLVIYFYPKDNTRVCTKEACEFRDNFSLLKDFKINVVGISTDSIQTHLNFKEKHQLPFELLSDQNGKVSKLYKAHIPFLNLSKRITYLLNSNHEIEAVINDLFSAERHIKEIIEKMKSVKSE